ncbi:hypothetical protein KXV22_003379 [Aspergillus fumigatus]|uniref:Short-chain dehydrogenase/reductase family protein, putative n=2 Tax=Aspergillus fumigatus TaxID=746128 RepID=Q4WFD6_ASPFU|nr:short-chain dehydrogenase/reductase family protein, putative [Aspergillus fumigatus Af293]KAF4277935.1 hypothetical protein CNMCM8057_001842 [Aspergillus fumigatus]EAL86541.1 short-chain dehydrogenase/reductase family protein, putative [Aspergillus fumigatus Af293]KAF4295972.1 hypothetical protein CNMCM8686_002742 [Aspergillus fumigatus]KAH1313112.1 hypothetical protein KXX47_004598 [Aspergillus fumigatus]KAH1315772.1 hypothetical protein KXX38_002521 [Aspergillus fumigatus]
MGFYYSQFFVRPAYPTQAFTGQTVVITGANTGLGLEAARHIVRLDAAKVVLAVRNLDAGEEAKRDIERTTGRPGVCEVWLLDLASRDSVVAFADRASTQLGRLDVLVANAAVATPTFALVDGHERTITVNVINTMLLAVLLLPKLGEAASGCSAFPTMAQRPGRLVVVVSETHAWTPFPDWQTQNTFETLDDPATADMPNRYATSKLMLILLLRELAARVTRADPDTQRLVVNMVNPGLCHSRLARDLTWGFWLFKLLVARSTEVGSRTLVAGAAAGSGSHGRYMTDGRVADDSLSSFVRSREGLKAQKKLWRELHGILEAVRPGAMDSLGEV